MGLPLKNLPGVSTLITACTVAHMQNQNIGCRIQRLAVYIRT